MRTAICIFAAILVLSSAAGLRKELPKFSFAEIDKSHFGNALVSTLAIHTSVGAPLDEIIALLATVRQNLLDQQEEADEVNQTAQATCDRLLSEFGTARDYHLQERDAQQELAAQTEANLETAQNDLAATNTAIDNNAARLENGQAQRDVRHQEFLISDEEYDDAVDAIDEATILVQHLRAGSSFIQLKGRFQKVQEKFKEHVKNSKHASMYTPVIAALTQLAAKADQETVRRILDLLAELRGAITNTKSADQAAEDQEQLDWDQLSSDLRAERESLNDKRGALMSSIETFETIYEEASDSAEYHAVQYENARDSFDATEDSCEAEGEQYVYDTTQRESALDIISRLSEHVETRIRGLKDYLINDREELDF